VVVHVDETRRDHKPLRIDRARGSLAGCGAHPCNAAIFDTYLAEKARISRAIDHAAVLDQDVEVLRGQVGGQPD
jgi:hypothetical protein